MGSAAVLCCSLELSCCRCGGDAAVQDQRGDNACRDQQHREDEEQADPAPRAAGCRTAGSGGLACAGRVAGSAVLGVCPACSQPGLRGRLVVRWPLGSSGYEMASLSSSRLVEQRGDGRALRRARVGAVPTFRPRWGSAAAAGVPDRGRHLHCRRTFVSAVTMPPAVVIGARMMPWRVAENLIARRCPAPGDAAPAPGAGSSNAVPPSGHWAGRTPGRLASGRPATRRAGDPDRSHRPAQGSSPEATRCPRLVGVRPRSTGRTILTFPLGVMITVSGLSLR